MADPTRHLALHGFPTGNCLRAAIALGEAGLDYEPVRVDLRRGGQRTAAHLALNPAGKVPVLVETSGEDMLVLTQSNAIALRADALAPGRIMPNDERRRSVATERWFAFLTDAIAPIHAAFGLAGPEFRDARELLIRRAVAAIHRADAWVREAPFMAGDEFTLADIAGFTVAAALREVIDYASHPALAAWSERVAARPAVQRGMAAFGG